MAFGMGGNCWTHTGPYERDLAAAFRRAQGRCTVLYTDGEPTHMGYWGVTAD
ncbi:hypothetical protein [Streptomyces sp. NPDC005141]